jgi:hypothetical protein
VCGRRIVPDRVEPVLDQHRAARAPAPPPRTRQAVGRKPPPPPSYAARLSRALAAWPPAPHAAVALGCVLAVAIYWSAARDDAAAEKAGAERLAAATGARPTTSQPAVPGVPEFSARQALQGLYGNYDPVLDGAFWTVEGAPKRWAEWNGKTVVVRPLVSRTDEAGTRHVLVTHTVDMRNGMVVKQGAGCRNCKSLIGAALFQRQGDQWKLVSDQRFLGVEGAFGAPPHIAVSFPAKTGVELRIEPSSLARSDEPSPPVVMAPGKKVKGVLTQPRLRPSEPPPEESPFPSSASGP